MIGVGAPWILGLSVFGALVVGVLHFLSVRRPPVLLLPTMRFLPERPVRAVSRSARPSDLLLMLMRVAALLLAGVALSGVTWRGTGVKHGRVVVILPGAAAETQVQQVTRALSGGFSADTVTRVVVVDSVAHFFDEAGSKSFRADSFAGASEVRAQRAATLSAGFLAATRAAAQLVRDERTVDVVDLVIAAPFTHESNDAAFSALRASWPGAVRLLSTQPTTVDSSSATQYKRTVSLVGGKPSDAVVSALDVRGWLVATNGAQVGASAGAAAQQAPISVEWPSTGVPEGWTAGASKIVGAVIARGEALVFPFVRSARIPESIQKQGRAIAWWSDGEVAAIEIPTATACTRHVGINVPASSDVLQGQAARALLMALSGPCGGEAGSSVMSAEELRVIEGTGAAAPATAFRSAAVVRTAWAPLLLVLALALLVAEWFVRDREDRLDDALDVSSETLRKVA